MSLQRVFEKLIYWDVYLSAIIHGHESLMLTVMLFLPTLIFLPNTFATRIMIMTYFFGYAYSIRYVISIVLSLLLTTFFKKHFKRPRPCPQLSLKLRCFCSEETNYFLPSGDCAEVATFLFCLFNALRRDIVVILIAILMTLNVMLGRVYFYCYYFSDCHLGFGIGFTSAFLINFLLQ